jgi:hypothetical protein
MYAITRLSVISSKVLLIFLFLPILIIHVF